MKLKLRAVYQDGELQGVVLAITSISPCGRYVELSLGVEDLSGFRMSPWSCSMKVYNRLPYMDFEQVTDGDSEKV